MKPEIQYFDISPRIVRADSSATVRIEPIFEHSRFDSEAQFEVTHKPMEDIGSLSSFREENRFTCEPNQGALEFKITFEGEQEHSLLIESKSNGRRVTVGDFRLYSVAEDIFSRRPFKGDLHIHSNRSDGREGPGYVAASCRKMGLDFMAVTDHGKYEPSIEAQESFKEVDIDLRIFRGEEIHPPDNPIHIINFGGSASVNHMFTTPEYRHEVEALQKKSGPLPNDLDPYYYASSLWCFDRIRKTGGLGIFCHPYWVSSNRYHIPGSLTSKLFEERPFDAYELIGGYQTDEVESNMLQVLRYQDESTRGAPLPVVGVSDAHGCDHGSLFGWYYTIVFSPSNNLEDLIESVKQCYSVAIEHLPNTTARAHGPFRLAKYAQFLMREVLPAHDAICRDEGNLMLRHLAADSAAADGLSSLSGRSGQYLNRCFASR